MTFRGVVDPSKCPFVGFRIEINPNTKGKKGKNIVFFFVSQA